MPLNKPPAFAGMTKKFYIFLGEAAILSDDWTVTAKTSEKGWSLTQLSETKISLTWSFGFGLVKLI